MSFLPPFCYNVPVSIIQPSCWKWISKQTNRKILHDHFYCQARSVFLYVGVDSGDSWTDSVLSPFGSVVVNRTVRIPKPSSQPTACCRNNSWQSEPPPSATIGTRTKSRQWKRGDLAWTNGSASLSMAMMQVQKCATSLSVRWPNTRRVVWLVCVIYLRTMRVRANTASIGINILFK